MERAIKYYSIPNDNCTCRDENGDLTKISLRYREFYEKIKSGKTGVEALNEMNMLRTCCRIKLLCLAVEPMIDRSTDRMTDLTVYPNIKKNTRDLTPLEPPPDFPTL